MAQAKVKLNDGNEIPIVGYGLYNVDADHCERAVSLAIKAGYRHFDSASFYGNEKEVGKALKQSGLKRHEFFITSKVWNDSQGYENTIVSCINTLRDLQLDYLDLYLVHWPLPAFHIETWLACEWLQARGYCKSIGVSNYTISDYKMLMQKATVKPVCNQIEVNPMLYRREVVDFFLKEKVAIVAYKPLKRGACLKHPDINKIANFCNRTAAEVCLRWGVQHGLIVIPKSSMMNDMVTNFRTCNQTEDDSWTLTDAEMYELDLLTTEHQLNEYESHYNKRRNGHPPIITKKGMRRWIIDFLNNFS